MTERLRIFDSLAYSSLPESPEDFVRQIVGNEIESRINEGTSFARAYEDLSRDISIELHTAMKNAVAQNRDADTAWADIALDELDRIRKEWCAEQTAQATIFEPAA